MLQSASPNRWVGPALTSKTRSFCIAWVRGGNLLNGKRLQGSDREADDCFVYHKICLLSIAVCFKCDVWLSSLDEAVETTQETFGDEGLESPLGGAVVSVLTATGDKNGD